MPYCRSVATVALVLRTLSITRATQFGSTCRVKRRGRRPITVLHDGLNVTCIVGSDDGVRARGWLSNDEDHEEN
jgi:hypothetical protein